MATYHAAIDALIEAAGPRDWSLSLWDGTHIPPHEGCEDRFTLKVTNQAALWTLVGARDMTNVGHVYIEGGLDVEGDMFAAFDMVRRLLESDLNVEGGDEAKTAGLGGKAASIARGLAKRVPEGLTGSRKRRDRVRRAVTAHYDIPTDFWELWLDEAMQYTCGYFSHREESIDDAQRNKMEHVCRKLDLKEGDTFFDLGCGWGGLITHAAVHHGVTALGVTLSEPQAEAARKRIADAGVADRCSVVVSDIRDLPREARFTKGAGVGIIEHLGEALHADYFQLVTDILLPGGRFLNQGITVSNPDVPMGGKDFLDEYIFPDHDIVAIDTTITAMRAAGLEVRDVESLREHYELTLKAWLHNFEREREAIEELVGSATYRAFRAYLAGMAHDYRRGGLNLYQTLVVKPTGDRSDLALTRAEWYA